MNRARTALVVVAVVAAVAAVFMLVDNRRENGSERRAGAEVRETAGQGKGGGGVHERDADLSAAATVAGDVVDEDGHPLDAGTLVLTCLDGDVATRIKGGILEIGEDGAFAGPGCRGTICAELSHPYMVETAAWVLPPGGRVQLVARRAARLHGRVEGGGAPVAAAKISFLAPDDEPDPTAAIPVRTRSTTTDADGLWSVARIERPPCSPCVEASRGCPDPPVLHESFRVAIRAEGFAPVTQIMQSATGESAQGTAESPWVVVLGASGDLLTGRLLDGEGEVYARAYVLARSVDRPHEQRRVDVDRERGNFEVDGLGEGEYGLRALQDGVELARGVGAAGDDVDLRGALRANGPRLVVEVRRGSNAVQGAIVDGGPFRGDRTDMKGQVSEGRVLAGTIALRVRAPGHPPVRREIVVEPSSDAAMHEVIELPAS